MTPQQIKEQEYDIVVINEIFSKLFDTDISAKFQKFVNDFRTGFVEVKSEDFTKLKQLLKDFNTKKINQDEFTEKTNSIVKSYI